MAIPKRHKGISGHLSNLKENELYSLKADPPHTHPHSQAIIQGYSALASRKKKKMPQRSRVGAELQRSLIRSRPNPSWIELPRELQLTLRTVGDGLGRRKGRQWPALFRRIKVTFQGPLRRAKEARVVLSAPSASNSSCSWTENQQGPASVISLSLQTSCPAPHPRLG